MKTIGSQKRESLKESGYKVLRRSKDEAVLEDRETGKAELWIANDDFAGYVIEIAGVGHEFARSL